jgi:hypothetical protein
MQWRRRGFITGPGWAVFGFLTAVFLVLVSTKTIHGTWTPALFLLIYLLAMAAEIFTRWIRSGD